MASLIITQTPGGLPDSYQCPHCGRMSLSVRLDDQGNPTDQPAETPTKCQRCGSPMDMDGKAVQDFQDAKALEQAKAPTRGTRRLVKV